MANVAVFPGDAGIAGQRRHADESGLQRSSLAVNGDRFQLDPQRGEVLLWLAAGAGAEPDFQQHANPAFITLQILGRDDTGHRRQFAQRIARQTLHLRKQLGLGFGRFGKRGEHWHDGAPFGEKMNDCFAGCG